jgi:CHAD domain-containing protein
MAARFRASPERLVAVAEYLPPAGFDLKAIGERLPKPLHIGEESCAAGRRSLYDTFDARLRDAGLHLVQEDGLLRLLGPDGGEIAALPWPERSETIQPADLQAGPLADRVAPACGIRVLLRTAEIDSTRRLLPILDEEQKTVARLVAEEAVLSEGPRSGDAIRPRLYVLGVRGYDKELGRVCAVVEDELGVIPATETFEDELKARVGSSPAGLSSDSDVELTPDLPADRATVALSMRLLHAIESNVPGTLGDLDTEFLHDLRVAVRRTRALQRELKKVFPPPQLDRFRQEFKWLQQVTGPSRDLDVYLLDFDDFTATVPEPQRHDLEALRGLLEEQRADERRAMESALRSGRTSELLRRWAEFLEQLPSLPVDDRPQAVTPIGEVAARRIDKVYRQMVKMGDAIGDDSPHEDLHDLRKKGKELRYLLEFFSPLFPGKVTKPMVKTLKALQDTLGRFQDREVQATMIRGLSPQLADRPGGAEALMAMGILVERLKEQQDAARAEFHERFGAFAAPEQRALVKKTFR